MLRAGAVVVAGWPRVVEPTVGSIEVKFGPPEGFWKWTQFPRVAAGAVEQAFGPVSDHVVHIFGNSVDLDVATLLLTYNIHGLLHSLMWKEPAGHWTDLQATPEMLGETDLNPSVRLVFQDDRAKQAFLTYYQQVLSEKVHNPSLQLVFSRLARAPIVLPVATEKGTDDS